MIAKGLNSYPTAAGEIGLGASHFLGKRDFGLCPPCFEAHARVVSGAVLPQGSRTGRRLTAAGRQARRRRTDTSSGEAP